MYSFQQITEFLQGQVIQVPQAHAEITHLLLDSRKLAFASQSLFFALKGAVHNGHDYLQTVYRLGVRNLVVSEIDEATAQQMPLANILCVKDTLQSLQDLAAQHRAKFSYPVLAITGSNGKTIVKEWLSHLLSGTFCVVKSPKSYNSQVGVPLSLWEMQSWHTLGVFEAGISRKGEMQNLQRMIQPTLGIFTNLGTAHEEGFLSREEKLTEKLGLFQTCEVVFYKKGTPLLDHYLANFPKKNQWIGWQVTSAVPQPTDPTAIQVSYQAQGLHSTTLQITYRSINTFRVPFSINDHASLENITHALLAALYLGCSEDALQQKLNALQAVAMRLSLKTGINRCTLIDDSYNNDLAGLQVALDFLQSQAQHPTQTVILSEILESGMAQADLYRQLAELLNEKKIQVLVGIGKAFITHKDLFTLPNAHFFESTEAFLADNHWKNFRDSDILVKGARKFTFEKIIQKLEQHSHGTVLEINLEALVHNLNFYRSLLKPSTQLMVMVKAYAYGSGLAQIAHLLQHHQVNYLAVAYTDEGVALRQQGVRLPIMVMNPGENSWEKIFAYQLEPEIYSFRVFRQYLDAYQEATTDKYTTHKIHLKIDTGMHRLGFEEQEIPQLMDLIEKSLPYHVQIASVFSHLAGADDAAHEAFSRQQIKTFRQIAEQLEDVAGYSIIKHILNSSGIVRFPETQLDMVRLGVGLYGIEANQLHQAALMPISTLKTHISQIKTIKKGETVGYGRWGIATQDTRIATIAIGYADGFSRQLSKGKGKVWVNGCAAPVMGNVCMDMTMIELGEIDAKEGDEVIIFSPEYSIRLLAEQLGTIPYEILTSISERVKRVFYT